MLPTGHIWGRVCIDPEYRKTKTEKPYVNLVIACDDEVINNKTHFFTVTCGNENLCNYIKDGVKKGQGVLIHFDLATYINEQAKKTVLRLTKIKIVSRNKLADYPEYENKTEEKEPNQEDIEEITSIDSSITPGEVI